MQAEEKNCKCFSKPFKSRLVTSGSVTSSNSFRGGEMPTGGFCYSRATRRIPVWTLSANQAMTEQTDSGPGAADSADFDRRCTGWIGAMAAGDEQGLEALYEVTLARVYAVALRVLGDEAAAEDVVSQTYFEAWKTAARYDASRGRPITWLLTICRNRALDEYRRRQSDLRKLEAAAREPGDTGLMADLPDLLQALESDRLAQHLLAQMEETDRQLIALAFFRGLSHKQVAEVTGMPLGSLKSRIRRALVALGEALVRGEVNDVR